jgi:Flp pilus assembly pilin Flp
MTVKRPRGSWGKFVSDELGLESVEYAIITGLIVAGTLISIATIGLWIARKFGIIQGTLGA